MRFLSLQKSRSFLLTVLKEPARWAKAFLRKAILGVFLMKWKSIFRKYPKAPAKDNFQPTTKVEKRLITNGRSSTKEKNLRIKRRADWENCIGHFRRRLNNYRRKRKFCNSGTDRWSGSFPWAGTDTQKPIFILKPSGVAVVLLPSWKCRIQFRIHWLRIYYRINTTSLHVHHSPITPFYMGSIERQLRWSHENQSDERLRTENFSLGSSTGNMLVDNRAIWKSFLLAHRCSLPHIAKTRATIRAPIWKQQRAKIWRRRSDFNASCVIRNAGKHCYISLSSLPV